MRKVTLLALIIQYFQVFGQNENAFPSTKSGSTPPNVQYFNNNYQPKKELIVSQFYLGFATGLNNSTGILGPTLECNLAKNVSAFAGAGIGTYGYKLTIGGRYYLSYPIKSAFAASFGYASGGKNVKLTLETDQKIVNSTQYQKQEVNLDLLPIPLFNLSWLRFWRIGRTARLNLELGYSININGKGPQNFRVLTQGVKLNDASIQALTLIQPGGFIIGFGLSFGL